LISSISDLFLFPLFVAQTRLINQNRCLPTFSGFADMAKRCGLRSLWQGWGGIFPTQLIISLWAASAAQIDRAVERLFGSSTVLHVFLREIVVGSGGFLLAYPFFTATRRVAAAGTVVGMSREEFYGVWHALWKITRHEGVKGLYNGFAGFAVAVISIKISLWSLVMPTLTQWSWMKIGPSREEMIKEFNMD
jgi:hypothetical protein